MILLSFVINNIIQFLTAIICRLDVAEIKKIPQKGPVLLVANHVNFLEVPVLRVRMGLRPVVALAKRETWDIPFLAFLFNMWGGIPIRRGEADMMAFSKSVEVIKSGKILVAAPEGTRSSHGRLQKGYPGIVLMALRSEAPVLPIALWGHENFWDNIKHLRRTDFNLRVGNPFRLNDHDKGLTREVRQQMTDEVMYQIAALLPEKYRGVYSDFSKATQEYIDFDPGVESNIK